MLSEPTPYVARIAETLSITDSVKIERDHGSQSGEYRFDACLRTRAEFDCDMLIVALPKEVPLDADRTGIPENPVKEDVKEALPNILESVNETSDAYWKAPQQ
ncbi:hypothetical protein MUK42_31781 [Musa troglodytarum]|uniref:Uncharacterized protein n=1 Tax=Musa troglodytarum TaxID=320322 RepID=A0A9E7FGF4_9LILI|nr:hypothetical protein MUK42_31781 [Musa troglodytarum]